MKIFNYLIVALAGLIILACSSEEDLIEQWIVDNGVTVVDPDAGPLDLSDFITVGTSLASGIQDGALYDDGQANSFPAMLAEQFGLVGGGDFAQPDINSENGFHVIFSDPSVFVFVGRTVLDLSDLAPVPVGDGEFPGDYPGSVTGLRNFGVPLITTPQLVIPATGFSNPANPAYSRFYERFASDPSLDGVTGSTILTDALSASPSFFVLETGINDVLLYALTGGDGSAPITNQTTFNATIDAVLAALSVNEGVVVNIPPVLIFPFFQAVPHNPIPIDQEAADLLNPAYAAYNGGLASAVAAMLITQEEADRRTIVFEPTATSRFVIEDETLTDLSGLGLPNYRMSEPTDIVLLTAATAFEAGVGTAIAAGDEFILLPSEQIEIEAARTGFNNYLSLAVEDLNTKGADIAFADINSIYLQSVADPERLGLVIDGIRLSPDFAPNGFYSTDGVHPNPRGAAIIANTIIAAMNERWGSSIPEVNTLLKRGIFFQP